ncbi:sigma-54-dependent transcriptional regulator [Gallaecimonas mangrovi]|uniref:sigma-54-dependent transcriptional regulator n=1 Tax=Gallaecimonas mangrovi TaxID=2291597 RepID=UPI000E200824|nr:sigma-54 dependent transcriptional regulator [Gallaecimonas mangrovi]
MARLHLVTDDLSLAQQLAEPLRQAGYHLSQSTSLDEPFRADLVIYGPSRFDEADYRLFRAHPLAHQADWLLVSDGAPNPWLDKLMRRGVAYHFRKPLDINHLTEVLGEFKEELALQQETPTRAPLSSNLDQFGLLLGSSEVMRRLYRLIRRVSQTEANVLLVGESGSGKELAARTIHQQSPRATDPFVAVNCAALSAELVESELFGHVKGAFTGALKDHIGFFERASEGTLFLDEVTEMPLELQSKLLRVLETGEFRRVGSDQVQHTKVRIVAATNRSPDDAIDGGYLREDLYFRLAHFPIQLPALRERGDDIVELARHFLAYRNVETGTDKAFTQGALDAIARYSWPGNVRQLKHCVERAHILAANEIGLAELPDLTEKTQTPKDIAPGTSLKDAERTLILATLEACQQNKTQAAEQLGVSVKTLYNKLERYQTQPSSQE